MNKRLVVAMLFSLSIAVGSHSYASEREPESIRIELAEEGIDGYWVHLPRDYNTQQLWPVLVYLHGADAVFEDLDYVVDVGPIGYAASDTSQSGELRNLITSRFIIIAPHLITSSVFDASWATEVDILDAILDTVLNQYSGDREKMYITGLSLGGAGSWLLPRVTRHSIAAVVPVCGAPRGHFAGDPRPRDKTSIEPNDQFDPTPFETIPVWNTSNARDGWPTRVFQSTAVKEIEALGGEKFLKLPTASPSGTEYLKHRRIFTSFDRSGHDAWSATYCNAQVYRWLLSFSYRDGEIVQED